MDLDRGGCGIGRTRACPKPRLVIDASLTWHLYGPSVQLRGQASSLPSATRRFPPRRHTTLHRPLIAGQYPYAVYPTRASACNATGDPGSARNGPADCVPLLAQLITNLWPGGAVGGWARRGRHCCSACDWPGRSSVHLINGDQPQARGPKPKKGEVVRRWWRGRYHGGRWSGRFSGRAEHPGQDDGSKNAVRRGQYKDAWRRMGLRGFAKEVKRELECAVHSFSTGKHYASRRTRSLVVIAKTRGTKS
jgi:hypothetical protein